MDFSVQKGFSHKEYICYKHPEFHQKLNEPLKHFPIKKPPT